MRLLLNKNNTIMKKIMMIAALMVATLSANAQNEVGQFSLKPTAGINIATITGDAGQKSKVGFVGGLEAEYGVAQNFGITAAFLYSMQGCKIPADKYINGGANGNANVNIDYLNIPILAQYYLTKGLAIKAGPQIGFNVRHKASYDGETVDIEKIGGINVNSVNVSIPVGISYEYKSIVLDARYNIGLTKVFKNTNEGRNSVFAITLGYKIPLN